MIFIIRSLSSKSTLRQYYRIVFESFGFLSATMLRFYYAGQLDSCLLHLALKNVSLARSLCQFICVSAWLSRFICGMHVVRRLRK